MRQEIVEAAQQIIQEKGIDGLSMRAIAKVVHTSPANLYEYFLNKEEIIVSVYNEFLAGLLTALQQVPQGSSGRAYLLGLCMQYIDYVGRDPSQLQIAGYPTQLEAAVLANHQDGEANAGDKPSPSAATQQAPRAVDPLTSAYTANTKKIFELFLQAVEKCVEEKSISSAALGITDVTHVVWALVHGLVTLSIQDVSMLNRQTMQTAIVNYLDGLSSP
ncbi:MAG: TetR/AcrR family transcriptional regulator [Caldilineaceae bacterium]|nr:TetR/AcrR family transcriptional regulator [Caldilineaceae bacterium]